jgi:broad specificity phosphatase PhoE
MADDVEKGLFLRKFGVPFWAVSHIFGRDQMYWYRLKQALGRNSIVGTTTRNCNDIPLHLSADEKHTRILGDKSYIAATVGGQCILQARVMSISLRFMEITLIRHGKPDYELKGEAGSKEIGRVIENYDSSGIKDSPPKETIERLSNIRAVVCSDLKRSIESANALGFKSIFYTNEIFREVATPHFKKGEFSMSLDNWGIFLRVISIFGFSRNGESLAMARRRAKDAASELISLAKEEISVLLVGHGFINYFIARELLSQNWVGPSKPGGEYWDYGTYKYIAS